jgi:uncharacterized protein with PIN domain
MTDDLRFLCDEMLVGLGRWLRTLCRHKSSLARKPTT